MGEFYKCLIVIIYSSLSPYLFSNFIIYFLCLCFFYYFVGDWKLKRQSKQFSGAKQEKFSKQNIQRQQLSTAALPAWRRGAETTGQKLSTATLAVWHWNMGNRTSDWQFPDPIFCNDDYKSLISPKLGVNCF